MYILRADHNNYFLLTLPPVCLCVICAWCVLEPRYGAVIISHINASQSGSSTAQKPNQTPIQKTTALVTLISLERVEGGNEKLQLVW